MKVYTMVKDSQIHGVCRVPPGTDVAEVYPEYQTIEGEFPADQYYLVDGVPTEKQEMSCDISSTQVVAGETVYILGAPEGCAVHGGGMPSETLADGRIAVDTSDRDGTFALTVSGDPYLDAVFLVRITGFEGAQSAKAIEIDSACREAILSGFDSDALGTEHHYPAKMTDQQNLASSVLDSLLPGLPADWTTPYWCADVYGVWELRSHTALQIQQVGKEAKAAILLAMNRNEVLQQQVAAASTVQELESILW